MKNPYYYIGANPTVDLIVLNPQEEILMIKRGQNAQACPGMWALPGGFIDTNAKPHTEWRAGREEPEQAALRELEEETNLKLTDGTNIFPVGVYEGQQRDPRDNEISWSKSHAYFYKIDKEEYEAQKENIRGLDDAEEAKWIPIHELSDMQLAFDHKKIIDDMKVLYLNKPKMKI